MRPRPIHLPARIGSLLSAWLLSAWSLCGGLAMAAPAPAQPEALPSVGGELLGILLPLALVIAVLFAAWYVVRRRFGLTGRDAPLSVVQVLPVGPRERIVVVKSRTGRVFAVGVSGQSVTLITNLDPSDLVVPEAPVSESVPQDSHTTR